MLHLLIPTIKKVRIRFEDDDNVHLDSDDEEGYVDEEEQLPPPPPSRMPAKRRSSDLTSQSDRAKYNTAFEIVLKRELYELVPLSREYSHEVRTDNRRG